MDDGHAVFGPHALPVRQRVMKRPYDANDLSPHPWRTDRLLLRPYTLADAETAHVALDRDEDVWRHDPGFPPTLDDRRGSILHYVALHDQFGFGPCAAFLTDSEGAEGAFVGQGGLNPYVYDHRDGSRGVEFEVMFKLARPYWGQGYAIEIARFWTEFAFHEVRLPRLCIGPKRENVRSLRVLERLGARIEDDWLDPESVLAFLEPTSQAS